MPSNALLRDESFEFFEFRPSQLQSENSIGPDMRPPADVDTWLRDVSLPDGFLTQMRQVVAESMLDEALRRVELPANYVQRACENSTGNALDDAHDPSALPL